MSKEIFAKIIQDFKERPDDFRITKYTLNDAKTGVKFWIASGLWFYRIYEPHIDFTLIQKIKFAWATRKILQNYDRIIKDLAARDAYMAKKELEKMFSGE